MAEYLRELRADGLPVDPWLRVHVKAGSTTVPGALLPVHCDLTHDHAVYVEPNVWVRHRVPRP
jgi:hypothetical protein